MPDLASKEDVLSFWFEEISPDSWFKKDDDFDETLRARFGSTVEAALAGELDSWADTLEGCVALILVLDQFPRNIYRGTPRAFGGDDRALELSQRCVERGYLNTDHTGWRSFMLMPMMHSEDLEVQEASLPLFDELTNPRTHGFAVRHRDIVARFGRFPHRNAILGRPSTDAEVAFLEQPGSSF
jgi:uncharacterized protein (DUF924 family)